MKNIDNRKRTLSPTLKIIPLGGLEEIGRNMTLLEYGNKILIVDMGLQFPTGNMPGIDFIIPNIEYLTTHPEKKIVGVFITHAHYDHIGAIPYLIDKLNYPTIYTTPLTKAIILHRQEEFSHLRKLDIRLVNDDGYHPIKLDPFEIIPIHLNHTIPDTMGLAIKTPQGLIMYLTDFKIDFQPIGEKPANLSRIAALSSSGVRLLMADSTGAERPGHSISETTIMENLDSLFKKSQGRIILATFASLISRLQQAIWLAQKYNRSVIIEGRSMKSNVEIARHLGYIQIKKGTLINWKDARRLPPRRLLVLCTGAQGEEEAVLARIANKEHRYLRIEKGDTVIFSSSVVPGNELAVQSLKDILAKQGADVYHYRMLDIHASGHAYQEDLKLIMSLTRPQCFMPIHGNYSMLKAHSQIAQSMGVSPNNIVISSNGQVVELTSKQIKLTKKFVPANYIMVDGLGVGDVGEIVLRDRQTLAKDGIFIIIMMIDRKTGILHQDPEIISRGFVYMKESKQLIQDVRKIIKDVINYSTKEGNFNEPYIRNNLRDKVGLFLFKKTQRRPMILPIITKV